MNASLQSVKDQLSIICPVEAEIRTSNSWLRNISGIKAEKLLDGSTTPYLYVLREGEHAGDYYVTYVRPDLSIAHQPFTISITSTGWYYQQGGGAPLSQESRLEDFLYLIMHCEKGECLPFKS